jgi:hypothetical protein
MQAITEGTSLVVTTPEGERDDVVIRLIEPPLGILGVLLVETERCGEVVIHGSRAYVLQPRTERTPPRAR